VGSSVGLEIGGNRPTCGVWIFSLSLSEALAFHASTVSSLSDYRVYRELEEGVNKKHPTTRLIYLGAFHILTQPTRQWDGIEILSASPALPPML